jgi:hypothetical protein
MRATEHLHVHCHKIQAQREPPGGLKTVNVQAREEQKGKVRQWNFQFQDKWPDILVVKMTFFRKIRRLEAQAAK